MVMQRPLMSTIIGGIYAHQLQDTSEEVKQFFQRREVRNPDDICKALRNGMLPSQLRTPATEEGGNRKKFVLMNGCFLAQRLVNLKKWSDGAPLSRGDMWRVIARVWVELLSYAACHCRGTAHASMLSAGGELINQVWLLMAHLGLSNQFHSGVGPAVSKIIFEK